MLHYAGAYVFGRYTSRRTVDPGGTVHTEITQRPRTEWPVLIKDHHEGYITWADYLANEARLAANHTAAGARPPREGTALCQGIIICGSCGKAMMTNYHTDQRPAYECSSRRDRLTTPSCRSVAAACVDAAVAGALLDALTPGQVVLALSAADEVAGRRQRASRAAELAVERARYDADRAERAFSQVEPENRLVARSLEARWEARLAALAEAGQGPQAAQDTLPPLSSRAELEKRAADLPALWNAPTTSARDRKRLLRTLIADVTLLPEPDHGKVRINDRQRAKRRRHGQGNWKLIRYADDFVLMVSGDRHHAEALREEVTAVLAPLGLRLSPQKTRVVPVTEGFDFLGHADLCVMPTSPESSCSPAVNGSRLSA